MEQRYFYRIRQFFGVYHSELEYILNDVVKDGGRVMNIDSHPKGTFIVVEYTKEEYDKLREKERVTCTFYPKL